MIIQLSSSSKQPRDHLKQKYKSAVSRNDKFVQKSLNDTLKSSTFDDKEDRSYVSLNSTISKSIKPFKVFVHNQSSQATQVRIG